MENTPDLAKLIPLLIPILLIQLALMIAAFVDLIRQPKTRGPKWVCVLIILFGEILGPIIDFIFGRKEE